MSIFRHFTRLRVRLILSIILLILAPLGHGDTVSVVPEKSAVDNKQYRGLTLDNGLKVMLVSDPVTDRAAAALDVHVGSGSDPEGWNGLAHFLEHMLFLGTEKYPEAGEYQKFIQSRGGSNNAYTAYDHTNYFFSVNHDSLEPALDRFSRFFIDPTFEDTYVDRERSVVHSEYQARLKEEGRRIWAAQKQILNQGHPASRFSVGSLETLADRESVPVREKLIEFYERWYSADIMALAVVGREDLDTLESWVRVRFSDVPSRDITPPLYIQSYLDRDLLPVRLDVVPLKELFSASFLFPIPSVIAEYRSKPVSYIANLLGHEGKGSLLAALKERGWADSLSAGVGFMDKRQGALTVSIGLTEPGLEYIDEIGSMLFHHIAMIKREGIEEWRFKEEEKLGRISFRFAEQPSAGSLARSVAARLHDYDMAEVLSGPYLVSEYDPDRLREILDHLKPEKVVLQVVSPHHKVRKVSPYYGVRYGISEIDPATVEAWQNAESDSYPYLALPEPNPFIPQRMELLTLGAGGSKPIRLPTTNKAEVWYQADQEFDTPRASYYFSIKSPVANDTARNSVLTELMVRMLNDQLNIDTYPARLAGLRYSMYRHSRGVSVRLGGYQDGQDELLSVILSAIQSPELDPKKLDLIKADYARELANSKKERPSRQTVHEVYRLVMKPYWTESERLAELEDVSVDELRRHIGHFLEEVQLTALGHGDISQTQTRDMTDRVVQSLNGARLGADVPRSVVRKLNSGKRYLRNMDVDHNDTAVTYYLQGNEKSDAEMARSKLLGQLIEEPFYFDLRTTHRVGYLVFAAAMDIAEVPGMLMSIQSPSHAAEELDQLVATFLDDFPKQLLEMSDDAFNQTKQGLIARILKRDNQLADRTDRYWTEIDLKKHHFDSRQRLAAEIEKLAKEDVLKYLERVVASDLRELVVQSPGRRDGAESAALGDEGRQLTGEPESFRSTGGEYFPAL